jgi:hypothetical protein
LSLVLEWDLGTTTEALESVKIVMWGACDAFYNNDPTHSRADPGSQVTLVEVKSHYLNIYLEAIGKRVAADTLNDDVLKLLEVCRLSTPLPQPS